MTAAASSHGMDDARAEMSHVWLHVSFLKPFCALRLSAHTFLYKGAKAFKRSGAYICEAEVVEDDTDGLCKLVLDDLGILRVLKQELDAWLLHAQRVVLDHGQFAPLRGEVAILL